MSARVWDDETTLLDLFYMLEPGDYVCVDGYGGYAKVIKTYQNGWTPKGSPIFRATLEWGPHNPSIGRCRNTAIDDVAFGKLRPCEESDEMRNRDMMDAIDDIDDVEALQRMLAEINAELEA